MLGSKLPLFPYGRDGHQPDSGVSYTHYYKDSFFPTCQVRVGVACRTPTAILRVQCGVPDPNRDPANSVWRPGPQPRSCEFSVASRTPTAENLSERMTEDMSERMTKDMSEDMSKRYVRRYVRKNVKRYVRKNVRRYVRKNVKRYVRKNGKRYVRKNVRR